MTDTQNQITPTMFAIARISELVDDTDMTIASHRRHQSATDAVFHSRIAVFHEQAKHDLRRAMIFLEWYAYWQLHATDEEITPERALECILNLGEREADLGSDS